MYHLVSVLTVLRHDHRGADAGDLEDGGHFVLPDLLGCAVAPEWVDEDEESAGAAAGRVEEGGEGGEPPGDDLGVGVAELYLPWYVITLPPDQSEKLPTFFSFIMPVVRLCLT